MPIYEYKCSKCQEICEFRLKIDEPAPGTCPHCHQDGGLQRLMSRSAFHLKGGGWYSDLYSSPAKTSAPTEKTSSSSDANSTSSPTTSSSPSSGDTKKPS